MDIEQVFWTATDPDPEYGLAGGYAVAAKSDGITDKLLEFLDQYHYPLGNNTQSIFNQLRYKSLVRFKDHLIFTSARTGVGHDGRDGTYSTHHLVFRESEFGDVDNDTRNLDNFMMRLPHTTRSLPTLHGINAHGNYITDNKTVLYYMEVIPNLSSILMDLRERKRVCLTHTKHIADMQSIIGFLAIPDRVICWSNKVAEPHRQPLFTFISGGPHNIPNKFKKYDQRDGIT